MAREAREERKASTETSSKSGGEQQVQSISAMAREAKSEKAARVESDKETVKKQEPVKTTRAAATRTEQRKPVARTAPVARDKKQASWLTRFRRNRFGNFIYEAYYELRYKVTWPTFLEARNMTVIVIILSAILAAVLAAVDYGLYNLFLLISGGR